MTLDPGQALELKFYIHLSVWHFQISEREGSHYNRKYFHDCFKDNFSKKNYVKFKLGKNLVPCILKNWHSLLMDTENSSSISKAPDGGHSLRSNNIT